MATKKRAPKGAKKVRAKAVAAPAAPAGIVRILNCIPSPEQEKDWRFSNAATADAALAKAPPAQKDLREPSWWHVGDQKSTGSCVGWATADSVVRWHLVKAGKIDKSNKLSVRFTWMASKETDEFNTAPTTFIESAGTSLKGALDVSRKYGAVADALLPFASGALYPDDEKTFFFIASQLKIANYVNLGRDPQAWRMWIANNGPILTRLDVDMAWNRCSAANPNLTVYTPANLGGHAVAIVGYTPDYFIVRNSWGDTWGAGGFAYASNAYAMAAFTEAYGVTL